VAVLGPLEIRDDGHVVDVSGAKQRAVVALLATSAGRVVSADRLPNPFILASGPERRGSTD
jgi:DNA-binding SARP family transcriptional activator